MSHPLTAMREFPALDAATVRAEVFAAAQPAVLRAQVQHWPAVAAARRSATELLTYLRHFDNGAPVDAIMTPPEVGGRVFYNEQMSGFNFIRNRLPISAVAEQVLRYADFASAPAVAVQSALLSDCLPGFAAENPLGLLDADVLPRIWLGTAITTPTHLDEWNNIGCVVSGRRRFTLFPPEQIGNLYIGPLDFAPTGAPMSLVHLHAPDFERFPRFRAALAAAVCAELAPGDAVYIPPLWWHHVESLEPVNLLINYWWHALPGTAVGAATGSEALVHALLVLRGLPPATRTAWQALFEHYVFSDSGGSVEHIPQERRGVLGTLSTEDAARVRAYLAERLQACK